MIIQTASPGTPRLAVMMHEHTALCAQFARAFGNDRFESLSPLDLMIYVIGHHDAGWTEFDRDPVTDEKTGLPYNLVETPAQHITVTSRLSPDFNERQHPYCGLISSMHSWGLYNGRYGLSNLVLIDRIPQHDRPLAARMLDGELSRQKKLKEEIGKDSRLSGWLDEKKIFQNYKQLQFLDTLALYFNRVHPDERGASTPWRRFPSRRMRPSSPSPGAGSRPVSTRRMAAGRRCSSAPRPSGSGFGSCPHSSFGPHRAFASSRLYRR
jgi:hypothetical protein